MSCEEVAPRLVLSARVDLRPLGVGFSVPRYSANVSKTGMFVVSYPLASPGTLVQFSLQLSIDDYVSGLAEVVWTRPESPIAGGPPPGMGLRFDSFESDGRRVLERYLKSYELTAEPEPERQPAKQRQTAEIPRLMGPVEGLSPNEPLPVFSGGDGWAWSTLPG